MNKPEHAQFFLEYINKKHKNMKFSIETKINQSFSFLDVKIFQENGKFVTSAFRKETFSLIMFTQRLQIPTVPKKELKIILLYLCKMSEINKTRPTKTMNKHMKFCKLRVIFQTNNRLQRFCS